MYMNKTLFEEEITFDLELNKDIMETILESYKTTYVMNQMYGTPEYNNMMANVNKNIENEFINIEYLQNDIMKKISSQQKEINTKGKILNDMKTSYTTLSKKESSNNNIANAADPRYKNTKTSYTLLIVYISIQVLSIIGLLFLYYKSYTPNTKQNIKNSVDNLKNKVNQITNKNKPDTNIKPMNTNIKPLNKQVNILPRKPL